MFNEICEYMIMLADGIVCAAVLNVRGRYAYKFVLLKYLHAQAFPEQNEDRLLPQEDAWQMSAETYEDGSLSLFRLCGHSP